MDFDVSTNTRPDTSYICFQSTSRLGLIYSNLAFIMMPAYCDQCQNDSCHRDIYQQILRSEAGVIAAANVSPNVARRQLYRHYVVAAHGVLGRGNRVVVPSCVRDFIRSLFPDPEESYMGHMAADDV